MKWILAILGLAGIGAASYLSVRSTDDRTSDFNRVCETFGKAKGTVMDYTSNLFHTEKAPTTPTPEGKAS